MSHKRTPAQAQRRAPQVVPSQRKRFRALHEAVAEVAEVAGAAETEEEGVKEQGAQAQDPMESNGTLTKEQLVQCSRATRMA